MNKKTLAKMMDHTLLKAASYPPDCQWALHTNIKFRA